MTAIVLSDIHLREGASLKAQLVIRFLEQKAAQFEKIFILGDLFDVWPGTTDFLIKEFGPVVKAIRSLVETGHEVHYIEGNHDFRLGDFFSQDLGVQVHPNEFATEFGKLRVYMAHGDLGNPKELGYRVLRKILRNSLLHRVAGFVPSSWIYHLGLSASKTSRALQGGSYSDRLTEEIRSIYRKTADGIFAKGYDVVMMGHTHIPDRYESDHGDRRCIYLNSGDWVKHFTYLEFDGSQFYTRVHPVSGI